jgi:hypothetical protein
MILMRRAKYWNLYRDEDIDLPRVGLFPNEAMPQQAPYDVSAMQDPVKEADIRAARHGYAPMFLCPMARRKIAGCAEPPVA